MILLDSSAIVCAVMREPEAPLLAKRLEAARVVAVGAPTLLECGMVLMRRGVDARRVVPGYMEAIGAETLDFRAEHVSIALGAFDRFGKGSAHRAQLNFGDCISYTLAFVTGLTLVYKGDDFGLTDLPRLDRLDAP